jgi:membrane protease YdiL (CAAX protease family)
MALLVVLRLSIDLILVAYVVYELTRRSPRMPRICALALVALGLRWAVSAAKVCGQGTSPLVYAAAALSIAAGLALLGRVPSRARVVLELADKLGVTRSALYAVTRGFEPSAASIAAAVGCAAALPALVHLTRMTRLGLWVQSGVCLAFALLIPVRREPVRPARILWGVAAGLTASVAIVSAARWLFDLGAETARCVHRLDLETKTARAAEATELARAAAKARSSGVLVLMTTLVFPIAEERVYRGLLQEVLTRKYGRTYGIFAASLAFGVAHLGIYQVALYQTVLLGIGFGIAYAEGGIVAAVIVHSTWNVLQLA